jgi:hypothetical protein
MNYSQFSKKLNTTLTGMDIRESIHFYGSVIQCTNDGILIDNAKTDYTSISEAKQHLKYQEQTKTIIKDLQEQVYQDNKQKIADIINEEHNIKVTNNIIDSYIKLASDKTFSIDPVVHQIREMNKLDTIVNGKIHYILEDNSVVAINSETQKLINNIANNNLKVVDYMKESSDNFLNIINVILQEQ